MSALRKSSILLCLAVLLLGSVGGAQAAVRELRTGDLEALLKQEPASVLLLDVRTPGEFQRGRVPGSVLVPMNEVPRKLAAIPRDKKVVVICATGARSAAVAQFLDKKGYPWVANYADGVAGWAQAGKPLER